MQTLRTTRKSWTAGRAPDYSAWLARIKAEKEEKAAKDEAERLKNLSLPKPTTEGKYESRIVQALVEIMTGRPTTAKPQKIEMPKTIYEPIVLELSSTKQFYYRVTPRSCTCKGWHYSIQKYGIGKCRHHTDAFPHQAAKNETQIEKIKAARKGISSAKAVRSKESRDLAPAEMKALATKLNNSLKGHPRFKYVLPKIEGIQSFEIRYSTDDQLIGENPQEEAEVESMIQMAKSLVPAGVSVYASSF